MQYYSFLENRLKLEMSAKGRNEIIGKMKSITKNLPENLVQVKKVEVEYYQAKVNLILNSKLFKGIS